MRANRAMQAAKPTSNCDNTGMRRSGAFAANNEKPSNAKARAVFGAILFGRPVTSLNDVANRSWSTFKGTPVEIWSNLAIAMAHTAALAARAL